MKKRLVIALAFALLLSLTACGGQGGNVQPSEGQPSENVQQPPPTPAPDPLPDQQPGPSQPEDSDPGQTPSGDAGDAADPGQTPSGDGGDAADPGQTPSGDGGDAADPGQSSQQPEDSGSEETATESQTSSQPAPEPEPEPAQDPEPAPDPEPEPTPDPEPEASPEDLKAIAQGLIGRPVSELYDAIGQPLSADYSPSCLDLDTDDGELTYDGFIVYTAGAPDNEVVYDVF